MNTLQSFAQNYINQLSNNLFVLKSISSDDLDMFLKTMVDYKNEFVNQNKKLDLKDLALVRIMASKDFPINLEYHTLQADEKKHPIDSPFTQVIKSIKYDPDFKNVDIGCNHSEMAEDETRLKYPLYRNTKHFSLNGLVSNVSSWVFITSKFNDKEIITIEPFEDHLNDDLYVLNPVDTFYNLESKPFKIGPNAAFVTDTKTYEEICKDQQIKDALDRVKLFLYSPNKIGECSNYNLNTQTCVTDLVLSYLGYIPVHSVGQTKLVADSYATTKNIIDDSAYLKKFQDLIESTNQKYLGTSYYNIPQNLKIIRSIYANNLVNIPGVFHSETAFYNQEKTQNLTSKLNIVKDYLSYLENNNNLEPNLSTKLYNSYSNFLIKCHNQHLTSLFFDFDLEKDIISFLEKVGYKEFIKSTKEFNDIPKTKVLKKEINDINK